MKMIYIVESGSGVIYAIFYEFNDAKNFKDQLNAQDKRRRCKVVSRTVFIGQPPILGFNR